MAAAYVGGAALEETFLEVFAVLHDTVKNVGSKAHMFKPILRHLESTLDRLLPMIKDIKLLSQQLDCPEEETLDLIEEMKKGEKLVRKCSKTRWRNYCFKVHYAIKLCKLDEDIARFGQVDLQMQKTTLVQMLCPDDKIEVQNESNFPVKVHPLPLSPGAATPSPSAPTPQPIAESESLWMNSHWQKGRLIGRGSFGSVYLATNRETGALCAMKEIELFPDEPKSAECIKQLQQEIKVLSQLKHPNIVQYYGSEIGHQRG
ncbi:RPW8-like protein 1 [Quercus suber]|uniref:RPW8-like protein 1 n=1 Tax=Quercus suber TaxID=58331 RepID=UPI0032E0005E